MGNRYIPEEDLEKILGELDRVAYLPCRIMLDTGYRVDDVMYMRVRDLHDDTLKIVERKTLHKRCVKLEGEVLERLKDKCKGRHGNSYVFHTLQPRIGRRRKMHRSTIWRYWERAVKHAGLDGKGYTLHSLRKVYAVRLMRKGWKIDQVQDDLGHTSKATTLLYALSDVL